ncbi:MAG: hydroxyacylglutathione hydrolase [Synechococcus sp. s2_metabat2_7]|nr:hydroxyacylglutathione hydrolase [Synechococcus sp. s2_metabat2_7]
MAMASTIDGIHPVAVLNDNIVWVWVHGDQAIVIDPAVADPIVAWLETRGLQLVAVLQTHHHSDHIGGTPGLLQRWAGADVVAAADDQERIPFQTLSVRDGDEIELLGRPVRVLDVRAHTRAHIAYWLPQGAVSTSPTGVLFCGDTLFSAGCGRLFEGTPADMHRALQKLGALPPETLVCCAHEYTEANLRWAAQQVPDDALITNRLQEVQAKRRSGSLSLPSSIAEEWRSNLFLRATSSEQLGRLRQHKDHWRG